MGKKVNSEHLKFDVRCHQKNSNNKKNFCLYAAFVRDYSLVKANTEGKTAKQNENLYK